VNTLQDIPEVSGLLMDLQILEFFYRSDWALESLKTIGNHPKPP
jgi:hypothetical protein